MLTVGSPAQAVSAWLLVEIWSSRLLHDFTNESAPSCWRRSASAVDVHAGGLERGQHLLGIAAVTRQRRADLAVIGERQQRLLGHRVDRQRRGERLDVERVRRLRVLRPGATPTAHAAAARPRSAAAASAASRAAPGTRCKPACTTAMPSLFLQVGAGRVLDRDVPAADEDRRDRRRRAGSARPRRGARSLSGRRRPPPGTARVSNSSVTLIGMPAKIASSIAGRPSGVPGILM